MFNRVYSGFPVGEGDSFLIPGSSLAEMPTELRELCEQYNADCVRREDDLTAESDWPVSVFVPPKYEPRYAYPLMLWFHDDDSSEGELDVVLSSVSDQNYCGLAIRGNTPDRGSDQFGWDHGRLEFDSVPLDRLVNVTVRRMRRAFHIHSERIFACGCGSGADVALQLLLEHPDWFAGAVLLNPTCAPEVLKSATSVADLRGRSVLQTVARSATDEVLAGNVEAVRMLKTSGVSVDVRMTDEPIDPASNEARFIDHWLISRITAPQCV